MKTKIITIIVAVLALVTPAIASHGHVSIGIGVGFPVYGAYGYWGPHYYHPYYYPYYAPVYVAPPAPVVVPAPVIAPAPVIVQEPLTTYVNVVNSNGSVTPVRIRRIGTVYVGPRGEQYLNYPTTEQLRPVYGF